MLEHSLDSGNFTLSLTLIHNDSDTHMYGLVVAEEFPFAHDSSLEHSENCCFVFKWLYFMHCLMLYSINQGSLGEPLWDCHQL